MDDSLRCLVASSGSISFITSFHRIFCFQFNEKIQSCFHQPDHYWPLITMSLIRLEAGYVNGRNACGCFLAKPRRKVSDFVAQDLIKTAASATELAARMKC